MIRTWSNSFRLAVAGVVFAVVAVSITVYFRATSTNAALLGPLKVPEGEDPALVQLEDPPESPDPGGDEIRLDEVDPEFVRYLRSHDEVVQCAALAEFAGMGAKARGAVPTILETLNDPKSTIRVEAAATLIRMDVQTKAAVRALVKELKADDAPSRVCAARTIGELVDPPPANGTNCWGPDPPPRMARPWVGKSTLPALVEALADPEPSVRAAAAETINVLYRFTQRTE